MGGLNNIGHMPAVVGPKDTSPLGHDKEDDRLELFNAQLRRSKDLFSDWRKDADVFYRAYDGDPWPEGSREHLESTERPQVSLNLSKTVINSVLGEWMSNAQEIRASAVDLTTHDAVVADWYTRILRDTWMRCHGPRYEAQAQLDLLVTGLGWGEIYLDVTDVPFRTRVAWVPFYEIHPDPDATSDNLMDGRFVIREKIWDIDEAKSVWPSKKDELELIRSKGSLESQTRTNRTEGRTSTSAPSNHNTVTIYEYQWWETRPYVAFQDETGQQFQLPADTFRELFETDDELELPEHVPFAKKVYLKGYIYKTQVGRSGWLQKPEINKLGLFTYQPMTGYRKVVSKESRVEWSGLMKLVYEPQMLIAHTLTSTVEQLRRGAKGAGWIEQDALVNPKTFKRDISIPGSWIMVKRGALANGKIRERESIKFPSFQGQLFSLIQDAIPQVTGVSEWLSGTATQERSNVLISNFQGRNLVGLMPLSEPVKNWRLLMGRLLIAAIYEYMPSDLIDQIISDVDGVDGVTLRPDPFTGEIIQVPASEVLKDTSIKKFDLRPDTAQSSPNERQYLWQLWQTTLPALLQAMPDPSHIYHILPDILRTSWPGAAEHVSKLADKLEGFAKQAELAGTMQGVEQALTQMDPEMISQVVEMAQGLLAQSQQPEQGAPQQSGPPQGQGQPQMPMEGMPPEMAQMMQGMMPQGAPAQPPGMQQ